MANWASTSYRIESKQKDLQEIYDLFMEFNENGRTPFDNLTDKNWEGNIVWALGGDTNNYYHRGFIQSCEISEGMLSIEAEEAWGASDFRHFLENHYKDMKVYFMVEEDGDCVYATNDSEGKYFSCRFVVDSCLDGAYDYECFNTEKEALQYIAELLEVDSISMEQLETWQKYHENEDDYLYFNEYKIVA